MTKLRTLQHPLRNTADSREIQTSWSTAETTELGHPHRIAHGEVDQDREAAHGSFIRVGARGVGQRARCVLRREPRGTRLGPSLPSARVRDGYATICAWLWQTQYEIPSIRY